MDKKEILNKTEKFVKESLKGDSSGHDWWHVYRVWKSAINIGKKEKANMFIVELGALLHDIADFKFHNGDDTIGAKVSREWLEKQGVDGEVISRVCDIVKGVSFKGAGVKSEIKTLEGMVVQDADRLDAIGAIGIARVFAYGGAMGREIYNPEIKALNHKSFEEYKNADSTSINHFYEKLLLLKSLMNTKTGKKMAEERHKFLKQYLDRFLDEWNGKI
ncbi:MAG: phosphohydrolase [Candidatus Moranbacteria bacterium RIFOXYA2_FULL_43_15]|nr:MAG: phosphohydrolase [Candidatus Moranbacteria bacterium RIFOXYA2_FULL_43_15]